MKINTELLGFDHKCPPEVVSCTVCSSVDRCFLDNDSGDRVLQAVLGVHSLPRAPCEIIKTFVRHEINPRRGPPVLGMSSFTRNFSVVSIAQNAAMHDDDSRMR